VLLSLVDGGSHPPLRGCRPVAVHSVDGECRPSSRGCGSDGRWV